MMLGGLAFAVTLIAAGVTAITAVEWYFRGAMVNTTGEERQFKGSWRRLKIAACTTGVALVVMLIAIPIANATGN